MAADAPWSGLPPGSVVTRPPTERGRRWFLRPSAYVLALICFTLPFLTVSCTKPGGYGRVEAGGTTRYSGFDLAFARDPERTADHLLPAGQWRDDVLTVQPLLWIALLCLLAGVVVPFVARRAADQERISALVAGLGLLAVAGGVWTARDSLTARVTADALARRVRLDEPAGTYVDNGQGLVLAVVLLLGVLVVELVHVNARLRGPVRTVDPRGAPAVAPGGAPGGEHRDLVDPAERPDRARGRQIGAPWEIELPVPSAPDRPVAPAPADDFPGSPSTPVDPRTASR